MTRSADIGIQNDQPVEVVIETRNFPIGGDASVPAAETWGAVDFLVKPVERGTLLEAIRQALERDGAARSERDKSTALRPGRWEAELFSADLLGDLHADRALPLAERAVKSTEDAVATVARLAPVVERAVQVLVRLIFFRPALELRGGRFAD